MVELHCLRNLLHNTKFIIRQTHVMLEPILYLIVLVFTLTIQMVNFLRDDRSPNGSREDLILKNKWHGWGLVLYIWCVVIIGRAFGWEWIPMSMANLWNVFDGMVNTQVLKQKWFYIGLTAQVD